MRRIESGAVRKAIISLGHDQSARGTGSQVLRYGVADEISGRWTKPPHDHQTRVREPALELRRTVASHGSRDPIGSEATTSTRIELREWQSFFSSRAMSWLLLKTTGRPF